MNYKTRGIVLRAVKYGETSIIVSIFTELFGAQSYIINGVRSSSKKGGSKSNLFQPGALLDLVVYHNDLRNLQRVKEYEWAILYDHLFYDVFKGAVAVYMIELLQKCLKQPEPNPELFYFSEDALLYLDKATPTVVANFPLFYSLHLANFFGFRIPDEFSETKRFLDLQEGVFIMEPPQHNFYLNEELSSHVAQVLRVMQPHELEDIKLSGQVRRYLLEALESYYKLHVPEFGFLRSLQVLQEVLGA